LPKGKLNLRKSAQNFSNNKNCPNKSQTLIKLKTHKQSQKVKNNPNLYAIVFAFFFAPIIFFFK
jgi:predicted permease